MSSFTKIRSVVLGVGYRHVLKPIFFHFDPEQVHDRMVGMGAFLGRYRATRALARALFYDLPPELEQTIAGIRFPGPVGLGGGFDKNAALTDILPSLGFGFMEVGSITGEACEGNPKPRLWRLPKSKSILVHYGLKNDGAAAIAARLSGRSYDIPLGINIAKTNSLDTVDPEQGIADYVKAYRAFAHIGSYTTINISCPNAFGGEPFTDPQLLDALLEQIDEIASEVASQKPIFLKISPDLPRVDVDAIIDVASRHRVDGFICTNLTKKRDLSSIHDVVPVAYGGMGGKVVEELTNALIAHVYTRTRGEKIIIGLGGVMSGADAFRKIELGASLVQLVTGMIFEGPQLIGQINRELAELVRERGFHSIHDVIGSAHKEHVHTERAQKK